MRFDFGELMGNIILGILVLFIASIAVVGVISMWKDLLVR